MAVPYSTRFLAQSAAAPGTYSYTVPAGYVAVLRDVDAFANDNVSGNVLYFTINNVAIAGWVESALPLQSFAWRGRQVARAGEIIAVTVLGHLPHFMMSGYLLNATG